MKLLILILSLSFTSLSFAQGHIFSSLSKKPDYLTLKKYKVFDREHYKYTDLEQDIWLYLSLETEELKNLEKHLVKNHSQIYCDGDYEFKKNHQGQQIISVTSITVCIDQDGWVLTQNTKSKLSASEVQKKASELMDRIKDC